MHAKRGSLYTYSLIWNKIKRFVIFSQSTATNICVHMKLFLILMYKAVIISSIAWDIIQYFKGKQEKNTWTVNPAAAPELCILTWTGTKIVWYKSCIVSLHAIPLSFLKNDYLVDFFWLYREEFSLLITINK